MRSLDLYKQRAKECLELAEKFDDDTDRQEMRELALRWQRLWDWAAEHQTEADPH